MLIPNRFHESNIYKIGLHIRINVDTGKKEAKLVGNEETNENEMQVVIPSKNLEVSKQDELFERETDELPEQIPEEEDSEEDLHLRAQIQNSVDHGQISQLSESLEKIQKYQRLEKKSLIHALETLSDLGHEIDFGVKIAERGTKSLLSIIRNPVVSNDLKEIAARAFGASLRNNPAAMNKLSDTGVVRELLEEIEKSNDSRLSSRLVYAVGSVVSNGEADKTIYSPYDAEFLESHGGEILRRSFNEGNEDLKRKISTFVYDRGLRLVWPDSELKQWSDLFQDALLKSSVDSETKYSVFETLTELHEYMGEWNPSDALPNQRVKRSLSEMLPVRDDFLKWLSEEAETYRYKRVKDENEQEYQNVLLRVRHSVYGNKMAERKGF